MADPRVLRRPQTLVFGQEIRFRSLTVKHFCPTSHVLCRISAHFNFFTKLKGSCFVSFTKGERHLRQCIAWSYTQETKPANTRQQEQFVITINSYGVADLPATTNIVTTRIRGSTYSVLHA